VTGQRVEADSSGAAVHPIMFWVLTSLAFAIFVPCTLVPIAAESERLRAYEQDLRRDLALLEAQYERSREKARALASDPLVNERVARRELNYRPAGEQRIRWSTSDLTGVQPVFQRPEIHPPADTPTPPAAVKTYESWISTLRIWLPAWPYRALFASEPQRTILLLMAGGMLLAAFLLYAPSPHPAPRDASTAGDSRVG